MTRIRRCGRGTAIDLPLLSTAVVRGTVAVPAGFKPETVVVHSWSIDMHPFTETGAGATLWRIDGAHRDFLSEVYDPHVAADGTFAIADVPAGAYTAQIWHPKLTVGSAPSVRVTIGPAPATLAAKISVIAEQPMRHMHGGDY